MKTTLFILFLLLGAAWTKSPVAHTVLVFKTSFCSSDLEETSFMVLSIESLVDMLDTLYCDIFQGNNTDKLVRDPELQARSDITTCVECVPSITSTIMTCALSGSHHGRYIQTLNLAQKWFNKIFIQDLVKIFNKIEKKKKDYHYCNLRTLRRCLRCCDLCSRQDRFRKLLWLHLLRRWSDSWKHLWNLLFGVCTSLWSDLVHLSCCFHNEIMWLGLIHLSINCTTVMTASALSLVRFLEASVEHVRGLSCTLYHCDLLWQYISHSAL